VIGLLVGVAGVERVALCHHDVVVVLVRRVVCAVVR